MNSIYNRITKQNEKKSSNLTEDFNLLQHQIGNIFLFSNRHLDAIESFISNQEYNDEPSTSSTTSVTSEYHSCYEMEIEERKSLPHLPHPFNVTVTYYFIDF